MLTNLNSDDFWWCVRLSEVITVKNESQGSDLKFKEEYTMVVQHNLTAMNSNRMLGVTTKTQAKSTEKLSSGYKINRAADDAAGLSISEKMRKQIRGLTQASSNAQDGISAVQTAEGALNEVQDMLQRMNELAVKAANGTNSEDDRSYIQNEIDQLTTEIDRVAETTKFNETYLLKGDQDAAKDYTYSYKIANANVATATMSTTASGKGTTITDLTFKDTASGDAQNEVAKLIRDQGLSVTYKSAKAASGDASKVDNTASVSLNGTDKYKVAAAAAGNNKYEIKDNEGTVVASFTINNTKLAVDQTDKLEGTETFTASEAKAGFGNGETMKYYDKDGNGIPENALHGYFTASTAANGNVTPAARADAKYVYDALGNKLTADAGMVDAKRDLTGALNLTLHVGADATSNNQITVSLDAMSAKGLGVNGVSVAGADDTSAKGAIETIKEAIQKVSTQRSALGAVQNRLEHTINNLDNVVENTTSAESQIRDTDMATEMVKYSNNNILAQAGQAMLAQSNQANQGVLSLLQ